MASDNRPAWESVSHLDADYKAYWSQWNRLVIKDSILYRRWLCEATNREHLELVTPESWRNEILKMYHSDPGSGHMGIKRTVERLRSRAYWPRLKDSVKKFCQKMPRMSKEEKPR